MKKNLVKVLSVILCFALVFCGGISVYAVEDTGITRVSCTINGDPATQRGFSWFTASKTDSQVVIYDASGADVTASLKIDAACNEWNGNYAHHVTVSGLTAGMDYTYKLGDGVNWETGNFATDNGDDVLKFITIADVQASSLANFEAGAKVLEAAYATMPDADFYANLGDFTNDSTNEEWDYYAAAFDGLNLGATLVPVTGNHDSNSNWFNNLFNLDTRESVQTKNGVNYSFDYGNAHIAVVNTNDMISITNAQLNWLRNDMNSTSKDWKIVFMHKSPYTLGKDGKWPDAQYLKKSLTAVCDEVGVDIVMSGHDHMYLRTKSLSGNSVVENNSGSTYVLSGTAGTKRYEIRDFLVDTFTPTEFVAACTIQKNGYGNYFDGTDYSNTDEANVGGVFNTVSIDGGVLTLTSYVVSDADYSLKVIDTMTIEKEQGKNVATFEGDNTISAASYAVDLVSSFMSFAFYTFTDWLPKFIKMVPSIIKTYIATGTF